MSSESIRKNLALFLLSQDAAREIGVSKVTLWAWVRSGKVPVVRVGREVLIEKTEVERLKAERGG